jgi:hypothetical protein
VALGEGRTTIDDLLFSAPALPTNAMLRLSPAEAAPPRLNGAGSCSAPRILKTMIWNARR